jgi:hypothetical protein
MMTAQAQSNSEETARGVLEATTADGHSIVLELPGTSYKIQLTCEAASGLIDRIGKRVKGTVHAKALRMYQAKGGGRFIEPIWGEPRIVAGFVLAVDQPNRRVLVDVAIPIWMTLVEGQPADMFQVGDLVNCYLQSGTRFEPA